MKGAANHPPNCRGIALQCLLNINRLRQRAKGASLLSLFSPSLHLPRKQPTKHLKNALKTPQIRPTLRNIFPTAANSSVFRVQIQTTDNKKVIRRKQNLCNLKRPKNRFSGPKNRLFSCRKGLPGLQRGRSHLPTGPPLHCRKGPAATSGGPYGRTSTVPQRFQSRRTVPERNFHLSWVFAE